MKITLDNWDGSSCKEEIYHVNSSVKLLGILERLDNKKHTLVNLVLLEENYLMIGGGNGKYVITGEENGIVSNLLNPSEGSTLKIELNTGGQIGLFESKYILSKEMAFKCAVKCFTIGCIPQNDLDFVWEKY
jgi:hypothetical protein